MAVWALSTLSLAWNGSLAAVCAYLTRSAAPGAERVPEDSVFSKDTGSDGLVHGLWHNVLEFRRR